MVSEVLMDEKVDKVDDMVVKLSIKSVLTSSRFPLLQSSPKFFLSNAPPRRFLDLRCNAITMLSNARLICVSVSLCISFSLSLSFFPSLSFLLSLSLFLSAICHRHLTDPLINCFAKKKKLLNIGLLVAVCNHLPNSTRSLPAIPTCLFNRP